MYIQIYLSPAWWMMEMHKKPSHLSSVEGANITR